MPNIEKYFEIRGIFMRNKKLTALLLSIAMVTTVTFVGCNKNQGNLGDNQTSGDMDKDQYLNMLLGAEPKTLDPSKAGDIYSTPVLINVQEALTRITQDENGHDKIIEGAATSWTTSEDGLTWTFTLRDNLKWNDGKPIVAEDFVYGIKRSLDPKTASSSVLLLSPIKNAVEYNTGEATADSVGVRAVDSKTIEFSLKQPCPYFLDLAHYKLMQPQQEQVVKEHGDKYGSEVETLKFSGPYMVSEWTHNSELVLVKNPEYWDKANVKLEKITMKILKEESARMNELLSGGIDIGGVSDPNWANKLNDTKEFNVNKGYDGLTKFTFFNTKDKLFSNAKIRKAFIIAEDRVGEIKTLNKGLGEPALAFCPPAIQIGEKEYRAKVNYSPVQELIDDNPDPKALLSEGLKELGLDPDPSKHTIEYLNYGIDQKTKASSEYRQQTYQEVLGININCQFLEWGMFSQKTDNFEFQVAAMGWTGDYSDPNTYLDTFMSMANTFSTGWVSKEYDGFIEVAGKESDQDKRAELFKQAEKLLIYDEGVISPGYWGIRNTYVRKYVKNYAAPMFTSSDLKYTYIQGRK